MSILNRKFISSSLWPLGLCVLLLAGCGKQGGSSKDGVNGGGDFTPTGMALPGSEEVAVEATGQADTREAAVDAALAMAVSQVNGKAFLAGGPSKVRGAVKSFKILSEREVKRDIAARKDEVSAKESESASASVNARARVGGKGSDGSSVDGSADYSGDSNARRDRSASVTHEVSGSERVWQVKVSATVIKFKSADDGKPRIVVADPRMNAKTYAIGDTEQSPQQVGSRLRQAISENISNTNRYTVIDRAYTDEIDTEISNVLAANANSNDVSKLGQRLTADLIVVPVIEYLEYRKSVRTLKLSGRELVSFAGGFKGRVTVIDVATGQVLLNESYVMDFPTTEPRAFGPGVDAQGLVDKSLAAMVDGFATKLVQKSFPIIVVSLDGSTAVLNQGGKALRAGANYELVRMGKEIMDPQTKRSLGRTESVAGTIKIDRVENLMSYGSVTLKDQIPASEFKPGMLLIRAEIKEQPSASSPNAQPAGPAAPAARNKKSSKDDDDDDDF